MKVKKTTESVISKSKMESKHDTNSRGAKEKLLIHTKLFDRRNSISRAPKWLSIAPFAWS